MVGLASCGSHILRRLSLLPETRLASGSTDTATCPERRAPLEGHKPHPQHLCGQGHGSSELKSRVQRGKGPVVSERRSALGGIHLPATMCQEVLAKGEPLVDLEPCCPHCLLLLRFRVSVCPRSPWLCNSPIPFVPQEDSGRKAWTPKLGLGHPLTPLFFHHPPHYLID